MVHARLAQDVYQPCHHLMRPEVTLAPSVEQRVLEAVDVFGAQVAERERVGPVPLGLADVGDEGFDRGHGRPVRPPGAQLPLGGAVAHRGGQRADQRGARP